MQNTRDISVIIPLCNEAKVLPRLLERIERAAQSWGDYEVIFVDDGSTDDTYALLQNAHAKNSRLKVIHFSRNFGHQQALAAGFDVADGRRVAVMDGDLQDPPELITDMVAQLDQGYSIVYAIRQKRKEFFVKRFFYATYYKVLRYLSDVDIPLDAGDFCVMDREVVDTINALPERNRFYRGMRAWTGFKSTGLTYERDRRLAGKTKYSFARLLRLGWSGIVSFSTKPLRIATYLGALIAIFSFIAGIVLIVLRFTIAFNVTGWTSLILAVFFMGGIQLLVLGMIGEYIAMMHLETQKRPLYVVKEKLGFK